MDANNVRRMFQNMARTATVAANQAKDAMQSASKAMGDAVSEKYDAVKLNLALSRLTDDQERVFQDLGRVMFLMKSGLVSTEACLPGSEKTPQQLMDTLLVSAEQLQQEIEMIEEKLAAGERTDGHVCRLCGRLCGEHDAFCAVCGTKLTDEEE